MIATEVHVPEAPTRRGVSRLAPLSGSIGVLVLAAALFGDPAPTSKWPASRIEAWYGTHSLVPWLADSVLLALAAPLLLLFTAVVGARLEAAGAGPASRSLLQGAGTSFAVCVLIGAGLYAAIPASVIFTGAPTPSAAVSRAMLGAAYGVLVMFMALAAALMSLTLSVAALQTGVLPLGFAVAGIPVSFLMLANAVLPLAVIVLWFVVLGIVLTVRHAPIAH